MFLIFLNFGISKQGKTMIIMLTSIVLIGCIKPIISTIYGYTKMRYLPVVDVQKRRNNTYDKQQDNS